MQIVLFALNAIVIYLLADWILKTIERRRGEVLKHRQVIFFGIFFALALISFRVMRLVLET